MDNRGCQQASLAVADSRGSVVCSRPTGISFLQQANIAMSRPIGAITADFDELRAEDFEYGANGFQRLHELCDEMRAIDDAALCATVMFRTMERLDESDLGSPGPLVHTLEACAGYEPFLVESLRRKPTQLSVWMVNRILNADPPDAKDWLALLASANEHPNASEETKAEALSFLNYQNRQR